MPMEIGNSLKSSNEIRPKLDCELISSLILKLIFIILQDKVCVNCSKSWYQLFNKAFHKLLMMIAFEICTKNGFNDNCSGVENIFPGSTDNFSVACSNTLRHRQVHQSDNSNKRRHEMNSCRLEILPSAFWGIPYIWIFHLKSWLCKNVRAFMDFSMSDS